MSDTIGIMTEARKQHLLEAANLLLNARRTHTPIADLPAALASASLDEAYFIQDAIAAAFGPIGGWKIGAGSLEATPAYAPMPLAWFYADGSTLAGPRFRYRVLEGEIAFLLGKDLPVRATPYTRAEVVAAISSCHPIIEELESGLIDPKAVAPFTSSADLQMNGAFVTGPAVANWQSIDFHTETVTLTVDGKVEVQRIGSNTSGDLLRLLPYIANGASVRTGGLKAGQWITTGSWTGNTPARAGSHAEIAFTHAGRVTLTFA